MACNGWKRITSVGDEYVVVAMRDLRDLVGRFGSTHLGSFDRCGKYAVFTRGEWAQFLSHHRADQHGPLRSRRGGGGDCDGWCDDVCERHDGCDSAGGTQGDCVAICNDNEVILQV
jgi:hypothetical protein